MSKPMSKPVLYGIFVLKFVSGLALIIWTVMMTFESDVGEDNDNAFLTTYHHVDDDFNTMITSNMQFSKKYNIEFNFNDTTIDKLSVEDVFLGQRSIKERKTRKNILKIGDNFFRYKVTTKDNQSIDNSTIQLLITMPTNHTFDKNITSKSGEKKQFKIKKKGYWNITGVVTIANDKGYFFIKTNAR